MSGSKRIENGTTFRVHHTDGSFAEIGDSVLGVQFVPRESLEFSLLIGSADDTGVNVEITPDRCQAETRLSSEESLVGEYCGWDLRIKVFSTADDSALRKWLVIENIGEKPVVLLDIVLEKMRLPDGFTPEGGGRGRPVYIKDLGFAAIEFPEFQSVVTGSGFTLEYYPSVTLGAGETYTTESAVIQLAPADPRGGFRQYVETIRRRKSGELFTVYSSHGAHECEGPNERVLNEELDHLQELKTSWRVPFEYFVVDYGYWSDGADPPANGDYTRLDDRKRFPGGSFDHLSARLMGMDAKLGMWFGLNCPACPFAVGRLQISILHFASRYGLKLVKLYIPEWDCNDSGHAHATGRHARYTGVRNIVAMLEALREAIPDLVVLAESFTKSPWWLKHVDIMSPGDLGVSDVPAPSMRDSQIVRMDEDQEFFENDAGVCMTYSDSHYWSGKQCWRKGLLMSLVRSNQISLSGQVHLFNDDDRLFLQRIFHMRRVHASSFSDIRRVDLAGGVYGYAATGGGKGIVALYNPTWEAKTVDMTADSLGCDSALRNVCVELFPDRKALEVPADGCLQAHMEPWEVSWFEIGPSEETCDWVDPAGKDVRNCPLLVTAVAVTSEIDDVVTLPVEQVLYKTGSMFRCAPVLPRSWSGFPVMVDRKRVDGELYINNRPVMWSDGAPYALMYPWTLRYSMLNFGKENIFYLATDDTSLMAKGEMVFSAVPYYSSSSARDDFPADADSTLVVTLRFLKDGAPYRYSRDPRDVRCSVWVDGAWTDVYRVPPNVPRIKDKFSWAVFMHDLGKDWECTRVLIPRLVDCDYEVEVFLTNRITAAEYKKGE